MPPDIPIIRRARPDDRPAIERLHEVSVRTLVARDYSLEQLDAMMGHVGTYEPELIGDGTYFLAQIGGELVGSGGWSRRVPKFEAYDDADAAGPRVRPAMIRSVFVHPRWVRRGIARRLVTRAESEARSAGFARLELLATLTGLPFYESLGYRALETRHLRVPNGLSLTSVLMEKDLPAAP